MMLPASLPPALLAATSLSDRMVRNLFDNTFAGIHQLDWFDWSLLIPYFVTLGILSIYGLHRYDMIRTYFKYRRNATKEPSTRFERLPHVTIQLPIYNERYVVERLIDEVTKIEYPRELLQIQVLDDSTDDTHAHAQALCERYEALGFSIEYLHRTDRQGFKAGALGEGLKTATGEFVAVFDADFIPPADFLLKTVHYFADPAVGVVQTRWSYLNREYNFLTEVEALLLDGHFILEHGARSRANYFFNFNGTAGILRRRMIDDAGGWQADTLTEDSDLSYRAQLKGWRFVYVPGVDCPSELPVEMHGFQVQQSRWAKGLTQVAMKILPDVVRAKLPWRVKAEAFLHLTPNISYPLMMVVSALMLPVMIVRFYMGPAADRRLVLVDLCVLRGGLPRVVSQALEALNMSAANAHGGGSSADHHQHTRRARGASWYSQRVCAHAQVRHRRSPREPGAQEVPAQERLAAVPRDRGRFVFLVYDQLRDRDLQLLRHSFPGAVHRGLLLGRFRDALPRAPEQAALAARAPRFRDADRTVTGGAGWSDTIIRNVP